MQNVGLAEPQAEIKNARININNLRYSNDTTLMAENQEELKDDVGERLNKTAFELYGIENFTDMVADETITSDCEELLNWLTEKGHPVLGMEPLM